MATIADLLVKIGIDADDLESGVSSAASSVEENLGKITAAGAIAGTAFEGFARTQQDSNQTLARTAAATDESQKSLRDLAYEMSNSTFAASDAAAGMELLTQKGIGTRQEFEKILPKVDDLADATGKDFTQALESADRLLKPLGKDMNDLGEETDQMTRLINQTDIPLGTLERNLGRIPDELQDLGFGLDETAAGIEVFRDRGYSGQEAVREFRRSVADSGGDMAGFLDSLGLTTDQWAEYEAAVQPATGLTADTANAMNDAMTPMQALQANVENLMFKYGGLADAAGMLALPLMALGPIMGTVSKAVMLLGKTSLKAGAMKAKAWLLALGPIGIVIAAVTALVVVVVKNWDTIKEVIGKAWDWVKDVTSRFVDWLTSTWDATVGAVVAYYTWLWDMTVAVFDGIKDAIAAAWNFVKDVTASVVGWLSDTWSSSVATVLGFFTNLKDRAIAIFGELVDWVRGLPGRFVDALSNLGSLLLGVATAALTQFRTGVSNGADLVIAFVKGLPSRIVRGLGKIGDLLLNAGKSIIRGLVRGIKSVASAPVNAVKDVVGKVRNFLPFSPAKEGPLSGRGSPEIAGATLVEMIADGMQSEVGDLARTAERAAAAALPGLLDPQFNGGATFGTFDAPSGAVNGRGGSQTIIVELDGREIGKAAFRAGSEEVKVRTGLRR